MKATALRSIAKINSNVLQNSGRLFSFKFEMTAANRLGPDPQEEAKAAVAAPEEAPKSAPPTFRYNVCQPRTTPVEKPSMAGDMTATHKQSVKAAIEEQNLQPSMLPEYFQRQMERNALVNPEVDSSEQNRINYGQSTHDQRRFQMSKTYSNAILPLKSVKLANPFPEPVKMMISRTVSDDEKAEQMLAEARSQRQMSDFGNKNFRTFTTAVRRWYSSSSKESGGKTVNTDPEKCKKKKKPQAKGKKGCPKMRLKGCPPPVGKSTCEREPKHLDCKKQQAPYPAYSEFCHEDIIEKPSECKLCPWKPEEHPTYKPPKNKRDFHTCANVMMRRSGLEMGFKEETALGVEEEPTEAEDAREGMQCDLRKPECERPKNRRCPPSKQEKKKEETKKKKEKPKNQLISRILESGFPDQPVLSLKTTKSKDKPKDSHGGCKIKKFKFPECGKTKQKRDQDVVTDGQCPKKKKKKSIVDCPPADDEKKCETLEDIIAYNLSSESDKMHKGKKCPKVDLTVLKEERGEDDEGPCPKKKGGPSKVCPADLLKKKHRHPRKKTSGIITPAESKTDMPQPRRTI